MKDERDTTQKANDDRANKVRSYDMMQGLSSSTAVISFNRKPFYLIKKERENDQN